MTEVISVKFKDSGREYFFDPDGVKVNTGENVIVDTRAGAEFGTVSRGNHGVDDANIVKPLRKMLRKATEKDIKKLSENKKKEEEAFKICEELILEHRLDMKLVEVEYAFDSNKIVFFFTSDGRVDFRELVKDLAARFHTRIELRQIGVRDEAKMLGGLGICGQPYCCKRFLWQRNRGCRSIRPRFRAAAEDLCAVLNTSRTHMSTLIPLLRMSELPLKPKRVSPL